jgi:hypothetical protein
MKRPLSKKEAWQFVGVRDVKTARTYVANAIELGLLKAVRSTEDRRVELLYPSPRLNKMMKDELSEISKVITAPDITVQLELADFSAAVGNDTKDYPPGLTVQGFGIKRWRRMRGELAAKKKKKER